MFLFAADEGGSKWKHHFWLYSQPPILSGSKSAGYSTLAGFIASNNNESVHNSSPAKRSQRRCTLCRPDASQPITVQFPRSHSVSVRHSSTSCSSDRLKCFCLHRWVVAANLPPSKKYMTQGQRKGLERLSLTFPSQVTICFRSILLCDSQSIKQHTQTHSSQGHPLPASPGTLIPPMIYYIPSRQSNNLTRLTFTRWGRF